MTKVSEFKTAKEEWLASNPILAFRQKHHLSQGDIATKIDASFQRIYQFEKGLTDPSETEIKLLSELIPDLSRKWKVWINERPSL